jgi:hypothetical protein
MCNFPGCKRPTPTGSLYCFMHNAKYGTVKLKDEDRSVARAEQEKEYKKVRKEYLAIHPGCECKECTKPSAEIHHMAGRIGDLLTDSNHFLAVCWRHHKQIEANPKWAKQEGYSISRLKK